MLDDDLDEAVGPDGEDIPDDVELDPTFTRQGRFPGTVKIVVESTTFWCAYHQSGFINGCK